MELGIDKKQIDGFKQFCAGLSKDRVMLRFVICALIMLIGWFTVLEPQATGLAAARGSLESARKQDKRATEVVFYTRQVASYQPYLFPDDDPLTLQYYVLEKIEASGASMRGMANKKTEARGVFKVSELELTATGTYSQLVDLVDRLEHGDKIVRLEKCRLLATKTQIVLDCIVKGLVKSSGVQPPGDGDEEGSGDGAGGEAVDGAVDEVSDDVGDVAEAVPSEAGDADPVAEAEEAPERWSLEDDEIRDAGDAP